MQLIKSGTEYVARCSFDERHIPKAAGFRWDASARQWKTARPEIAARLRDYASEQLAATLPAADAPTGPTLRLAPNGLGWAFHCERDQNAPAKAAGFRWNPTLAAWVTADPAQAAALRQYADAPTGAELDAIMAERMAARIASRATDYDVDLPRPDGLDYLGYQKAGIAYAMKRKGVLIGDEMGLGKTIQAIGIANADPTIQYMLILCPATLKLNWLREFQKWSVRPVHISLATTQEWTPIEPGEGELSVTVAHYDIFSRATVVAGRIRAHRWDVLVADEAHLMKNAKAGRTKMILGYAERGQEAIPPIQARRRVFLTGTPIVNRPAELWPLIHALDPNAWGNWFQFATRYCNGHRGSHGWDFTGSSNLDELQDKLRETVMIRRLKKDVLTELPAKFRQVIELPANGAAGAVSREASAWAAQQERLAALRAAVELAKVSDSRAEYEAAVHALRAGVTGAFTEMAQLRHDVALAKVPYVIEHVLAAAEEGSKIILFAHHRDVMEALADGLASLRPVQIHGGVTLEDRQKAVDTFQQDNRCRLFIGQLQAAGVGITLTASSHVVFAELDWVPGNLSQCEDRAHRIGQRDSVLVQHLVLEGSLDAHMARILVDKQKVLDGALDNDTTEARAAREAMAQDAMARTEAQVRAAGGPAGTLDDRIAAARSQAATEAAQRERSRPVDLGDAAASSDATPDKLAAEARDITAEQVEAVHAALRFLAGMDADRARARNNIGFNMVDGKIGHALAERDSLSPKQAALGRRIARKYHRQLGAEALEAMGAAPVARR